MRKPPNSCWSTASCSGLGCRPRRPCEPRAGAPFSPASHDADPAPTADRFRARGRSRPGSPGARRGPPKAPAPLRSPPVGAPARRPHEQPAPNLAPRPPPHRSPRLRNLPRLTNEVLEAVGNVTARPRCPSGPYNIYKSTLS